MITYPNDWEESKLLDHVDLVQGLTYTPENVKPYGTLVLRSSNIQNGKLSLNDNVYVNARVPEEKMVQPGDILVCVRNGSSALIGKSCVLPKLDHTTFGAFMSVLRGDSTGYFAKIFESNIVQEQVRGRSNATINQITKKDFQSILVTVPSEPEQEEIARTLSYFDTYIDDLTELIEKKRGIRDGALEDLVTGKTRLDHFTNEWEVYDINGITRAVITGGTPSTSRYEYYGGNIPWLSSTEIHQKRITKPTTYITDLGLQNSSAKIAPERSVLIALAGQGKTRGTAAFLTKPMALNQSLAALVTNEKCHPEFLYYLIESMYLYLRELSSGDGGRGGLNKKLIKSIEVTIPTDIAEQEAIANVLTAMDEEIDALETERDKMIQIREGAMDDLLTGRVRLRVQEV